MARSAASVTDRELTARLAARGLTGWVARYERWRRAGLLVRRGTYDVVVDGERVGSSPSISAGARSFWVIHRRLLSARS